MFFIYNKINLHDIEQNKMICDNCIKCYCCFMHAVNIVNNLIICSSCFNYTCPNCLGISEYQTSKYLCKQCFNNSEK